MGTRKCDQQQEKKIYPRTIHYIYGKFYQIWAQIHLITNVYGFNDFTLIKQDKVNKDTYWSLGIITVTIQRVREVLRLSPLKPQ